MTNENGYGNFASSSTEKHARGEEVVLSAIDKLEDLQERINLALDLITKININDLPYEAYLKRLDVIRVLTGRIK